MGALAPLRAKAEEQGSSDLTPFWSGQASPLGREMPAMELTRKLVQETVDRLKQLGTG
jgi:nitronate monooxygenase